MRLLLDRGANIEAEADGKVTPLHVAALCGQLGAIRLLVERGAKLDARNEDGMTPLDLARYFARYFARDGDKQEAAALLEELQRDPTGTSPAAQKLIREWHVLPEAK